MRAAFAALLFCAACEPSIASGTYLCGPEELCPEGLKCNRGVVGGTDEAHQVCVSPGTAKPFECGDKNSDVPGDDAPATAQSLGDMQCVSLVAQRKGCLPAGDVGDFYTFRVADGCTNTKVQASVVFPLAWQSLVMQIGKLGETPVTVDTPCSGVRPSNEGEAVACLTAPVEPGTYAIGVIPDGTGNCGNECRFNRYGIAVQVTTQ
jgi:hypothetical protein